jgi:hypothetical protein
MANCDDLYKMSKTLTCKYLKETMRPALNCRGCACGAQEAGDGDGGGGGSELGTTTAPTARAPTNSKSTVLWAVVGGTGVIALGLAAWCRQKSNRPSGRNASAHADWWNMEKGLSATKAQRRSETPARSAAARERQAREKMATPAADTTNPMHAGVELAGVKAPPATAWKTAVDEATGRSYYFNPKTKETRWTAPPGVRNSVRV